MLQRAVWGHARHPNMAATLMLGLGCEANQIPMMLEAFGSPSGDTFHTTTINQSLFTKEFITIGFFNLILGF